MSMTPDTPPTKPWSRRWAPLLAVALTLSSIPVLVEVFPWLPAFVRGFAILGIFE